MKTILIICLSLFISCSLLSQQIVKQKRSFEVIQLKNSNYLNFYLEQDNLKKFILYSLNSSFKYYQNLKNGKYSLKITKEYGELYSVDVINMSNNITVDNVQCRVLYEKDIIRIETDDALNIRLNSGHIPIVHKTRGISDVQILEKDSILWDKIIINDEELPNKYWTKILNRTYTTDNLEDQNGEKSILFKHCVAGIIIPYNDGLNSKLLTLDDEFHSILYFDASINNDDDNPLNGWYGNSGSTAGHFNKPTSITVGKSIDGLTYPVYVSDYYNNRIVKVDYVVDPSEDGLGHFENKTFKEVAKVFSPTEIVYFAAQNQSQDKLWGAHESIGHSVLYSMTTQGVILDRCIGYKDHSTGIEYYFSPGVEIKFNIYNKGFSAIAFIDKERNLLVTSLLDKNGFANIEPGEFGGLLVTDEIIRFPSTYQINSVSFLKTSPASILWPYLWVTSPSFVHLFKMNNSANIQYLASTNKPMNSDVEFSDLLNTVMTDDYMDILTIETWNGSYGIRKYWPFCSIYSDSVEAYCLDSTDIMRFKGTFTNDCWLRLVAKRRTINNTWENVKIKTLNGGVVNDTVAIKWQLAGQNQASSDLFIDIQLDLPLEDYALGGQVKLQLKMFPEYYVPSLNQKNHVTKEYTTNITKTCLPKPGGCPFLYVKDENNDFTPDNNLLHRMEFSEPNVNITDRYKLRIIPNISNGAAELYLVENENDFAFIDQVKVYAVDYPNDKKMGVTEDNKIVILDSVSVIASDSVILGDLNITSNVNYFNPSSNLTNGYKTDSLYAHFSYPDKNNIKKYIQNSEMKSQSSSKEQRAKSIERSKILRIESTKNGPNSDLPIAFITNLRNLANPNPTIKDTAGYLTATSIFSNTVSKVFARRELESVVILPLFNDTDRVDHLNIKWQSDFRMKYLGIANLNYSNYSMTEMPIIKGSSITISTDSAITTALTSIDGINGEVNSSALIKMTFDVTQLPSVPDGYKREYVIDVTGNYINSDNNISSKVIQNIPLTYSLSQNYPNPFNPTTKINYELPKNNQVTLVIYDILGREVIRLVNNDFKQAGRYTVEFNGQNFASGVYFYRIEAGTFVQAKKMVLVK